MRFHVPGLPHTLISKDYCHCAYTQKVLNFRVMMERLGHEVFVYESEDPLPPDDNLTLKWDVDNPVWVRHNMRCISRIGENIQPRDFIAIIGGSCQAPIAQAFPSHTSCEFGVGYYGIFSRYCVFESYFHMANVYGKWGIQNGRFFDTVIPNYYDVRDYPVRKSTDNYVLFVGRLNEDKGIRVAADAAKAAGVELIYAGQGGCRPSYGKFVGRVGVEDRGNLMSGAIALLAPSLYLEPFGGVATEAQLCGTPVITTDWGGFTETVEDGKTGFRCHYLGEFIDAIHKAPSLDRDYIRNRAITKYSLESIAPMYDNYFKRLNLLWKDGWNTQETL